MATEGKFTTVSRFGREFKLRTQLFIDNKYVDSVSGKTWDNVSPIDGKSICHVSEGDAADVEIAVKSSRAAFNGPWSKVSPGDRGRMLFKLADLLEARAAEFSALETLDNGKPLGETANADIPLSVQCLRYYAGWADKIHGQTIPVEGGYFCYTRREPVGVCGCITPFNFPLLMLVWKIAPALVTGNTVIMKPAEQTPMTALLIGDLIVEAGFPPGVFNVIPGFGPTAGGAMVAHRGIDKIAFTGSAEVGKIIMAGCAQTLKRVSLELGGKSPLVVFDDADLDAAVEYSNRAVFFNQGEVCTAGSRLFVQESIYDAFLARIIERAKNVKVGDPFEASTEMGAQVSEEQFDRIMSYIKIGKDQGAKCVIGGDKFDREGFFVQPTIFSDVTPDHRIYQEEIFGPVLSVIKFKTTEEVIELANQTDYGLGASVFTQDIKKAFKCGNAIRAGTVWINGYHNYSPAAPFGGFKQSGIGREKGEASLNLYTETKCVFIKEDE